VLYGGRKNLMDKICNIEVNCTNSKGDNVVTTNVM
jgi:hypothetical protein